MSYNSSNPNPVLLVPPLPPSPVNLLVRVGLAFYFSVLSTIIFSLMDSYPHNAPVESFLTFLAGAGFWGAGVTLGIMALVSQSKRTQFNDIILNYTKITGDQRYLPYVIKSSIKPTILILFAVLSFCGPILFSTILGELSNV